MTQHSVGDRLARGDKSASFSTQAGLSDFENDLIFRPELVEEKYGLTAKQVAEYQTQRSLGNKVPDLPTKALVEDLKEAQALGFTVTDRRIGVLPEAAKVEAAPLKYPPKEYTAFKPILDRVLVKRTNTNEDFEELSDGSLRDKKTGFITLAKYRQHQNVGIVLAVGDFVVMGGVKTYLSEIIRPGDRVIWGDYNSETFSMAEDKVEALCDSLGINYVPDEEGLRIVRVQDIRGVEQPVEDDQWGV